MVVKLWGEGTVTGRFTGGVTGKASTVKEVQKVLEGQLGEALEKFDLERLTNDKTARNTLRSSMQNIISAALERGDIVGSDIEMPLIDINNEKEKEHLLKRITELEPQRRKGVSPFTLEASDPIDHELWELGMRLSVIRELDRLRDPSAIDIDMKDPDTFEPWILKEV